VLEKAGMASEPHPENDGRRFLESTIADALREAVQLERERLGALIAEHIARWDEYPDGAIVLGWLGLGRLEWPEPPSGEVKP